MDGAGKIVLKAPLAHVYLRHTVEINANVALATRWRNQVRDFGQREWCFGFPKIQDETKTTYLYSFLRFADKCRTTLEIRVNDIKWKESQSRMANQPTTGFL
jgi:hypothetical protein